jgi:MraZ protein
MFIGEYKHNLDSKGRLAIPAKFRSKLKSGAVVTRGLDNCLFLYPKEQWQEIAQKLAELPISQAKARAFSRLMLAGAMDVEIDSQGRVTLPEYLRQYARLSKKSVVAGLYDRLEIWNQEAWDKYKQGAEAESTEIAEALSDLGV